MANRLTRAGLALLVLGAVALLLSYAWYSTITPRGWELLARGGYTPVQVYLLWVSGGVAGLGGVLAGIGLWRARASRPVPTGTGALEPSH